MNPATLPTASTPQIEAELLGRAIARGWLQIDNLQKALACAIEKQTRRQAELVRWSDREAAALGVPVRAPQAGELDYWRLVRRAYPEMCTPYVDLRIRMLESQAGKEAA